MIIIDVIEEAVTAVSTAAIAIYTVVLAKISKRQGNLIEQQIRLAREKFVALTALVWLYVEIGGNSGFANGTSLRPGIGAIGPIQSLSR